VKVRCEAGELTKEVMMVMTSEGLQVLIRS
jgi:hypothetical protein